MYIHNISDTSNLMWTKATNYIIEERVIDSVNVDYIKASQDSKLIQYSPIIDTCLQNYNLDNPLKIKLDDLLDINLEDKKEILNFYNKYGDLGLFRHKVKRYITASRWMPTDDLSSKSPVLSITPYQSEYFFEKFWQKRLINVGKPIVVDKERYPDLTKSNDNGLGDYNNQMKRLLGTLVRNQKGELVGRSPDLIFDDYIEYSQLKYHKDFGAFMGKYYPGLVLNLNDLESQLLDFPLPYSIDYFKNYAEPLVEVKKVINELRDIFKFLHEINDISVLTQSPTFYIDEKSAKSYYGRDKVLNYLPKPSIFPMQSKDSLSYRWGKSWIFKSLSSMFALKIIQEVTK